MKIKNNNDAIEQFRDSAVAYTELLGKENNVLLNKYHSQISKCAGYLKKNNSLNLLIPMLNEDSGISTWAALYLLTVNEEIAVEKLKKIRDAGIKFKSMDAKYILMQWEDQTLNIYFGD
jgi:hypothetical protein